MSAQMKIAAETDYNDPNDAAWEAIRSTCQQYLDNKIVNQRQLSKESGVNESALNQFLNRKYVGRNDRISQRLQNWIDTNQRRVEAQAEIPTGPGFIYTATAQKIEETLTYAHMAPDIALIYGAAGVGKTEMFREYARNNAGVCIATMTPAHATVNKALIEIGKCVGIRPMRDTSSHYDALCKALEDRRALLIIDEAQNLGNKALDQIRQIHDRVECGIVLAGNDQVYTNMSGRRAEYLDRIFSRVGMKTRLKEATQQDAAMLIEAWGISDSESTGLLLKISKKPGALRIMTKVLKLSHMISEDDKVQPKHIRAAWNRLSHDGV